MIGLLALQAVCNTKDPRIEVAYNHLTTAMIHNYIVSPLRMAMFVAQTAHESGCYRWTEELASGQAYEFRKDLGNTQPGDGVKYKGRGYIQVTGKKNYERCSPALFGSLVLLEHPEKLAEPEWAAKSAGWFWDWKNLNAPSDEGDVLKVTKVINGGTNGLAERIALYKRACYALGIG